MLEPIPLDYTKDSRSSIGYFLTRLDTDMFINTLDSINSQSINFGYLFPGIENRYFNKEVIAKHIADEINKCMDIECLEKVLTIKRIGTTTLGIYLNTILPRSTPVAKKVAQLGLTIIALHFDLISPFDALNSVKTIIKLIVEKEKEETGFWIPDVPFLNIMKAKRLYANLLGDSFLYHISQEKKIKEHLEGHYDELTKHENFNALGITPSMYLYFQTTSQLKEDSDQELWWAWRGLGTLAFTYSLKNFSTSHKKEHDAIIEKMIIALKPGQSFVKNAGVWFTDLNAGHALVASIKKNHLGTGYDVSLFNTGVGIQSHAYYVETHSQKQRNELMRYYRSHYDFVKLPYQKIRGNEYFQITVAETNEIAKKLYLVGVPGVRTDSKQLQPWHYIRMQQADTCTCSSIWAWLRSSGPIGLRLEIDLKMKLIKEIITLVRYFEDLKKNQSKELGAYLRIAEKFASEKYELLNKNYKPLKDKSIAKQLRKILTEFPDLYDHPSMLKDLTASSINEVVEYVYWLATLDKSVGKELSEYLYVGMIEPYSELLPEKIEDIAQAYEALELTQEQ